MRFSLIVPLILFAVPGAALAADTAANDGWYLVGSAASYSIGTGIVANATAPQAVYIRKSGPSDPNTHARLERSIPMQAWRGKRLRLSLQLKGENAAKLYAVAQIDKANGSGIRAKLQTNRFGDEAWQTHVFVLDVPDNATNLLLDIGVTGDSAGWVDDVTLAAVGKDVARTSVARLVPRGQAACGLSGGDTSSGTEDFTDCSPINSLPDWRPPDSSAYAPNTRL